jgi:hypothetical protein
VAGPLLGGGRHGRRLVACLPPGRTPARICRYRLPRLATVPSLQLAYLPAVYAYKSDGRRSWQCPRQLPSVTVPPTGVTPPLPDWRERLPARGRQRLQPSRPQQQRWVPSPRAWLPVPLAWLLLGLPTHRSCTAVARCVLAKPLGAPQQPQPAWRPACDRATRRECRSTYLRCCCGGPGRHHVTRVTRLRRGSSCCWGAATAPSTASSVTTPRCRRPD